MPMAKKTTRKPALKVVFDTNALWTDPAHHLLSKDCKEVIAQNSTHADVEISWHLPEVVLHERAYQMQEKALALLTHLDKVEKLLDHKLAITEDTLKSQVRKVIEDQRKQHKLVPVEIDNSRVDWKELSRRAAFREPPFEQQKEGKGFRDALILEALVQLVEDSPATEAICRVAFVSNDTVIVRAAEERLRGRKNVRVLKSLEELKGLINTIVSEIPEELVEKLGAEANELFFDPEDKGSLFYKVNLQSLIETQFQAELQNSPFGATKVAVDGIGIEYPNFVRKSGTTIHWASRINYALKATKQVPVPTTTVRNPPMSVEELNRMIGGAHSPAPPPTGLINTAPSGLSGLLGLGGSASMLSSIPSMETVTVNTSRLTFEVSWSTTLGRSNKLRAPKLDGIKIAVAPWGDPVVDTNS